MSFTMGQALYRKYRSRSLDEVVGQEHITDTLRNALKSGNISHAYLFTGPHGVGKTSVARILAHEINAFPYSDDSNYIDIIEIDAASNRRIDEIRDLRDKVHTAPTSGKYKVYIIDEVHMLTKEAFNALLKTLEEPPQHVIFILATTEAHKLPNTIVSRTQRFSFRPINSEQIIEHLKSIAKSENISVDDDALELLAQHGNGSFRDSISMLDQAAAAGNTVTKNEVLRLLGVAPDEAIENLANTLLGSDPADILTSLDNLHAQGYQAPQIAKQISALLRQKISTGNSSLRELKLLKDLLNVQGSSDPYQYLELTLIGFVLKNEPNSIISMPVETAPKQTSKIEAPAQPQKPEPQAPKKTSSKQFDINMWPVVLDEVKKVNATLYGVLRMAVPTLNDGELVLEVKFPFHQKRLNEAKNRTIIQKVIKDLNGSSVTIVSIVNKDATQSSSTAVSSTSASAVDVDTISNIFGGAELLNS